MRKLLFLGAVGLLITGGSNIWHAVWHPKPTVTTLSVSRTDALPAHVTLKDISFSPLDTVSGAHFGVEDVVYIPVRAKDADPKTEYHVVVKITDPALIAAFAKQTPIEGLKLLAAIAARTEVTGMVDGMVTDSDIKSLRKAVPLVAKDVVIIHEGKKPSFIAGLAWLASGMAFFWVLTLMEPKETVPAPPVLPSIPPKLG
ncbi:MAG TPA: hypothetical protein VHO24_07930 [Opitutaceae bacterium]|nr:hypothetical protein [Opitutaceae bacterium]